MERQRGASAVAAPVTIVVSLTNPVTGAYTQGFGRIDPNQAQVGTPRTGQLVLRLNF
jgi:hypothetical protein